MWMRASIKEAECGINTVGKAAALQAKELPGNPSPASVEHRNGVGIHFWIFS